MAGHLVDNLHIFMCMIKLDSRLDPRRHVCMYIASGVTVSISLTFKISFYSGWHLLLYGWKFLLRGGGSIISLYDSQWVLRRLCNKFLLVLPNTECLGIFLGEGSFVATLLHDWHLLAECPRGRRRLLGFFVQSVNVDAGFLQFAEAFQLLVAECETVTDIRATRFTSVGFLWRNRNLSVLFIIVRDLGVRACWWTDTVALLKMIATRRRPLHDEELIWITFILGWHKIYFGFALPVTAHSVDVWCVDLAVWIRVLALFTVVSVETGFV